jgi:hypothetical protein
VPSRCFSLVYGERWWFLAAFGSRKSRLEEMQFLYESLACRKLLQIWMRGTPQSQRSDPTLGGDSLGVQLDGRLCAKCRATEPGFAGPGLP